MNSINAKRINDVPSKTFKRNGKLMIARQIIKPLERATSGIGAKGDNYRRYITSMATSTRVYHATKGWRKA